MKRKSSGFILLTAVLLFSGCTLLTGPTMDGQEISLIKEVVYKYVDSDTAFEIRCIIETGVQLKSAWLEIKHNVDGTVTSGNYMALQWKGDGTYFGNPDYYDVKITVTDSKGNTEVFIDRVYIMVNA
jgi:hypothetical protein